MLLFPRPASSSIICRRTISRFDVNVRPGWHHETAAGLFQRGDSITLAQTGQFEIKAQSLFPNIHQGSGVSQPLPRFAIRIVESGQTVYHRRYTAHEISLAQALATATRWTDPAGARRDWHTFALGRYYSSGRSPSLSDGSLNPSLAGSVSSRSSRASRSVSILPRQNRNHVKRQRRSEDSIGNETTFAEGG